MTRLEITALRRLISAILFLIAGTFNIVNLFVFRSTAAAQTADIALESIWCLAWFAAAVHQLAYRGVLATRIIKQGSTQPYIPQHTLAKAILIESTASAAVAMDGYRLLTPSTPHIMRILGSTLWVGIRGLDIALARHERREAKQPDQTLNLCRVKPSVYYALHACLYLTIGTCYAAALWGDGENAPQHTSPELAWIKPIPNLCWLLAGINEVTRTLENVVREHSTRADLPTTSNDTGEEDSKQSRDCQGVGLPAC